MTPSTRPLALRFLWGPLQENLLPLERGRALVIGRQPDADLVIEDELISRRHARLAFEGQDLVVEDLGSTNGIYLNGARVERGRLVVGDRLLVGGSIVKVVAGDGSGPEAKPPAAERRSGAMQGRIEEVPLQDILQLFTMARTTGVLSIRHEGHEVDLEIDKGSLVRCAMDGRTDLSLVKVMARLLAWTQGSFELHRSASQATPGGPPPEPMESLLLEGTRQVDELRRLLPTLPARLAAVSAPTEEVDEHDRSLLSLVAQSGSLEGVLDATPLADLDAAQRIAALLLRGLLREGA